MQAQPQSQSELLYTPEGMQEKRHILRVFRRTAGIAACVGMLLVASLAIVLVVCKPQQTWQIALLAGGIALSVVLAVGIVIVGAVCANRHMGQLRTRMLPLQESLQAEQQRIRQQNKRIAMAVQQAQTPNAYMAEDDDTRHVHKGDESCS